MFVPQFLPSSIQFHLGFFFSGLTVLAFPVAFLSPGSMREFPKESCEDNYLKRMDPRKDLMIGLLATWSRVTLHQMHCLGFLSFSGQEKHGNCGHQKLLGCSGDQPATFCLGFFDGLSIPFFHEEASKGPRPTSRVPLRKTFWSVCVWPAANSVFFRLDTFTLSKRLAVDPLAP